GLLAAGGNLFATTRARDVMIPCSIHLSVDDTFEQAQAVFDQSRLSAIAVVDGEGHFAGVITSEQMGDRRSQSASRPRASGSVRLLKQIMVADIPKFDESATLSELMEFFTGDGSPLAVVVRERRPTGIVFCQSLAALNERLSPKNFAPPTPYLPTTDYLLVPDSTAVEAV
ncbi:MAG: CBS domain-containing protein, partial [Pirellulaceae bacterium]